MFNYKTKILDSSQNIIGELKLFLDPKDIIHQVYFCYNDNDYSAIYDQKFCRQKIDQINWDALKECPGANWFFLLLQKIKAELNGNFQQTFLNIRKVSQEDLVCRCFGVTRQDIEKVSSRKIEDVMIKTKASAACGSCRERVMYLLSSELSRGLYYREKPQRYWVDLYSQKLEAFMREHQLSNAPIELISFAKGVYQVKEVNKEQAHSFAEHSGLNLFFLI